MSDRTAILSAIRSAKRGPDLNVEEIAKEAAALVANPARVQPKFDGDALLERFVLKATSERVTATVDQVSKLGDVPAAVSAYLAKVKQTGPTTVQDCAELTGLDWSDMKRAPTLIEDGGIAVTLAEYGIAETGSVVFRSNAQSPILLNFLPLYHVVVLRASTLLAHPENLWPLMGGKETAQSRLLTIVTGTSGTADIEARNVRGAHGPRYMHIVIVTG